MAHFILASLALPFVMACIAPAATLLGEERIADEAGTQPAPVASASSPGAEAAVSRVALLSRAAKALTEGDAPTALSASDAALVADGSSTLALFLRGVALLDLGRLDDAAAALTRAVEIDPADASTWAVLARVHHDRGQLDLAADTLQRVLELEPDEARHWTNLGLIEFEAGRWNPSHQAFLRAVELDPEDADAHHGLGRLYLAAGETERAERALRSALEARPADATLWVALGHVQRDLLRGDDALATYRRAADLDPENPWIEANIGSSLLEMSRLAEARQHFERALARLDGDVLDHALVLMNYGMTLEGLGDLDGARMAYVESTEREPSLGRAYAQLGFLDLDSGRADEARASLDRAFRFMALDAEGVVRLALLHEEAREWSRARECAASVLQRAPSTPGIVFAQAQLLVRSRDDQVRDVTRGLVLLDELLAGGWRAEVAGWLLMAEAHEAEGDLAAAVSVLDEAAGAVPAEESVQRRLARERERLAAALSRR